MNVRRIRHRVSAAAALVACATLAACAAAPRVRQDRPPPANSHTESRVDIDHVIIGIDSLEHGIELLRRAAGVTAVFGGSHPGRGTQNALVSLGAGHYLELLAPDPRQPQTPETAQLATLHTLTPVGWAVRTPDAETLRDAVRANGLPGGFVRPGSRQRPDGSTLRWKTLNPWASDNDLLPFFIEWAPDSPHPSSDAPAGCTLAGLRLTSADPDALRATLARGGVDVEVVRGPREAISLTLDCPAGRVSFPAAQ